MSESEINEKDKTKDQEVQVNNLQKDFIYEILQKLIDVTV